MMASTFSRDYLPDERRCRIVTLGEAVEDVIHTARLHAGSGLPGRIDRAVLLGETLVLRPGDLTDADHAPLWLADVRCVVANDQAEGRRIRTAMMKAGGRVPEIRVRKRT